MIKMVIIKAIYGGDSLSENIISWSGGITLGFGISFY
jgi:hypothetical protein